MKSWGAALISIGCISIMMGPVLMESNMTMVIQGVVLVGVGSFMCMKSKWRNKGHEK